MAKVFSTRFATSSTARDVLEGAEPGMYLVTVITAADPFYGPSDVTSSTGVTLGPAERTFVISVGELFVLESSPGYVSVLAIPYVGQNR